MGNKNFFTEVEKIRTISVIGCGWLGFPFGVEMVKSGWKVLGTTTSREKLNSLREAGIEPYLIKLPDESIRHTRLFESETYIINIPPGRRNPDFVKEYSRTIESIINLINRAKAGNLIFVSSTSVYPEDFEIIDEDMQENPSSDAGKAILVAEQIVKRANIPWTILRMGGLAGPGRHPGRFFSGKTKITHGDQVINFLHREDAVGIMKYFTENPSTGDIYNVTAPIHPLKRNFYLLMARNLGIPEPMFDQDHHCLKREISSEKLIRNTRYKFIYPDPMNFTF